MLFPDESPVAKRELNKLIELDEQTHKTRLQVPDWENYHRAQDIGDADRHNG